MADEDRIAPTAHYTAYTWKYLGLPYADLFATQKGAALFWGFRALGEGWLGLFSLPTMSQYLAIRHRLIDGALEEAKPDVVVELGAGLSRRGTTWAADHKVRYIEVDLPHQIAIKRRLLDERGGTTLETRLGDRLRLESADVLAADFDARLQGWLAGAKSPVVIAEGLIGYFAIDDRKKVVRSVAQALRALGGGTFLTESRVESNDPTLQIGVKVLKGAIRLITSGRGTAQDFANLEEANQFFLDAGFDEVETLSRARHPELTKLRAPAYVWRARVR